VRDEGRRPGPPPWSGPPSSARALATVYTSGVRDRFKEISPNIEPQVNGSRVGLRRAELRRLGDDQGGEAAEEVVSPRAEHD
jgi:hypothetical protein